MPYAWRIVKKQHAESAFSGKGAADYGGRWNSRGTAVVYVSSTKSLAALEMLVHLNPPVLFRYVAIRVHFPQSLVERFPARKLPSNWRLSPPPAAAQWIGDHWVQTARSAILELPSAIIPGEPNYLINPAHSNFAQITIDPPEPFAFDPRLLD